jgi:hypothetical protein
MSGEYHLAVLHIEIEPFDELGDWFFGFVTHRKTALRFEDSFLRPYGLRRAEKV